MSGNRDVKLIESCRALVLLGPWLELCKFAEVPFVPAEFSEPFPVRQILAACDPVSEDQPIVELKSAWEWYRARLDGALAAGDRVSARFECCSCEELKNVAAQGKPWGPDYYVLSYDDPRVHDCTVGDTTRLCIRPWVEALRYGAWPVEFRFFASGSTYALSSYYPRRPLSKHLHEDLADAALLLGMQLADAMMTVGAPLVAPYGFSADFIVREDGEVLFLEGGPPHVAEPPLGCPSAHPCCMEPGNIYGIAFARRKGALDH